MGFLWVGSMAASSEAYFPLRRVLLDGDTSLSPLPPEWGGQRGVITVLIFRMAHCVWAVGWLFLETCEGT